jgi:hypothetical protein
VKGELISRFHADEDKLLTYVSAILEGIPQDELIRVFQNWVERVGNVIDTGGECICSQNFVPMQKSPGIGPSYQPRSFLNTLSPGK